MDIKDKKEIALHALEMARLALHPPFVCKGTDCTECPFYTENGECISIVLSRMTYKVREGIYCEK